VSPGKQVGDSEERFYQRDETWITRPMSEVEHTPEAAFPVIVIGEVNEGPVVAGEAHSSRIIDEIGGGGTRGGGIEHLPVIAAALAHIGAEDVRPQLVAARQVEVLKIVDPRVAFRATDGVAPEKR